MSKARQTRLSNLKSLAARRGGGSLEPDEEHEASLGEAVAAVSGSSQRTPSGRPRGGRGRWSRSPASRKRLILLVQLAAVRH